MGEDEDEVSKEIRKAEFMNWWRGHKGKLRSSDPPDRSELLGESPQSRPGATIASFKIWADCLDEGGQPPTETLEVPLPNAYERLPQAKDDKEWERLIKEINEEVDRRIRKVQDQLREKCFRSCELEWHDVEMRAYPNGESATYYYLQFKLTLVLTRDVLGTWTTWVRVPGGHTHYGCRGNKLLKAPSGLSGQDLLGYAKNASGFEFATPPSA